MKSEQKDLNLAISVVAIVFIGIIGVLYLATKNNSASEDLESDVPDLEQNAEAEKVNPVADAKEISNFSYTSNDKFLKFEYKTVYGPISNDIVVSTAEQNEFQNPCSFEPGVTFGNIRLDGLDLTMYVRPCGRGGIGFRDDANTMEVITADSKKWQITYGYESEGSGYRIDASHVLPDGDYLEFFTKYIFAEDAQQMVGIYKEIIQSMQINL
jgi:hypothetical protein